MASERARVPADCAVRSLLQVEWDSDPGNQEIQTITTSTFTGPNEIISITTSAADVDEVQEIRTTADHIREEQLITTSCDPYNTLSGTFTIKLDTTATGGSVQTSGQEFVLDSNSHDLARFGKESLPTKCYSLSAP